jgi:hypothetical protein
MFIISVAAYRECLAFYESLGTTEDLVTVAYTL